MPALVGVFSLESEWQKLSSGLQDFSEYSNQSYQYYSLDGLNSSSSSNF